MRFFGKKPDTSFLDQNRDRNPSDPPVRPAQVRRLMKLVEAEDDAVVGDEPGTPGETERAKVQALFAAAARNSTRSEIRAAYRAVAGIGE
jgi:hypothetical protein